MNKLHQASRWQKIRKLFRTIHLWLGLSSGLIVVAVCFSGTVYVFNTEITEASASHLYKVTPAAGAQRIPVDSLAKNLQSSIEGKLTNIIIPSAGDRSYQFSFKNKKDSASRNGTTYMVNPYTGAVLGNSKEKNATKTFMSTMFSLHRWLLLDKVERPIFKSISNKKLGSIITGTATIIFTLGCITGLVIWFPQKIKYWRQGLRIKWDAGWKRINHDLHNSLAFYSLIFLLLMGLTGPQWSFEWYRTGLQKTLGTYKPKEKTAKEKHTNKLVDSSTSSLASVESILVTADKELPYPGNYNIAFPSEPGAKLVVSKTKTGFFAPAAADRLTLEPGTAQLAKKDIFKKKAFNERVAASIKAIHVGNVYGSFTKLLYFLACLIATSLPITGTLIWINKMKKKKRPGELSTNQIRVG